MNEYCVVLFLGIILRWCVSFFPYSGAGSSPMYGDYEAQRHWQEITVNLPINEWYKDTEDNDLQYWGLDYPPLTAYHSYLCGLIAQYLNPEYVELYYSRGFESPEHKLYMRYTVIFADLIVYIFAAYTLAKYLEYNLQYKSVSLSTFYALLLYPGIYLIDYGHFQYNNVSLGLFIFAIAFVIADNDYLTTLFFSLALNYKQMELYHALPFFFYLLGKNLKAPSTLKGILKIFIIGIFVFSTFAVCWLPFLKTKDSFLQVVYRVFPVGRGLYEDKVASFWCSVSVIFKLKKIFSNSQMALLSLLTTAALSLPSSLHLLLYPKPNVMKYSLINVSFIFFLFSFHVHEKSILLVAIPACLIFSEEPLIVTWFFMVSCFSMFPLLLKDGLLVPFAVLTSAIYFMPLLTYKEDISKFSLSKMKLCVLTFYFSISVFTLLISCSLVISPPPKYPDLYPVLISILSCGHYCAFCLYFHYCQFSKVNYDKVKIEYTKPSLQCPYDAQNHCKTK